jgi:hypothetical protein
LAAGIERHRIIASNEWLKHLIAPCGRVTVKDPELLILSQDARQRRRVVLGARDLASAERMLIILY